MPKRESVKRGKKEHRHRRRAVGRSVDPFSIFCSRWPGCLLKNNTILSHCSRVNRGGLNTTMAVKSVVISVVQVAVQKQTTKNNAFQQVKLF